MQMAHSLVGITVALMLASSPAAPAKAPGEMLRAREIAAGYDVAVSCSGESE